MKRIAARTVLLVMVALSVAAPGTGNAAGNLAPNPSFEASPTDPTGSTTRQPMLPTGWAFEGSAGLFDHSMNDKKSGTRMVAISIPASSKREECQNGVCVDSPLNIVKDNTAKFYSVTPFWRTVQPIPLFDDKYVFSVWHRQVLATAGHGGAITKVRWLDATGVPLSESPGPTHIQKAGDADDTGWVLMSKTVTRPAGARGAILMLGAGDDLFISQIRYDDVSFSAL